MSLYREGESILLELFTYKNDAHMYIKFIQNQHFHSNNNNNDNGFHFHSDKKYKKYDIVHWYKMQTQKQKSKSSIFFPS